MLLHFNGRKSMMQEWMRNFRMVGLRRRAAAPEPSATLAIRFRGARVPLGALCVFPSAAAGGMTIADAQWHAAVAAQAAQAVDIQIMAAQDIECASTGGFQVVDCDGPHDGVTAALEVVVHVHWRCFRHAHLRVEMAREGWAHRLRELWPQNRSIHRWSLRFDVAPVDWVLSCHIVEDGSGSVLRSTTRQCRTHAAEAGLVPGWGMFEAVPRNAAARRGGSTDKGVSEILRRVHVSITHHYEEWRCEHV